MFTYEMSVRKDHKLITDGLYAWIRHQANTGSFLFFISAGCCITAKVSVVVARALSILLTISRARGSGNPASWTREQGRL